MRVYTNKEELITEIKQRSQKYIAEFEKIPEDLRNRRTDEVDKTPSENLSYQLGWLSLLLGWKEEEKAGIEVQTLAEGYKWYNLGGLYQSFYDTYREETLDEQMQQLNKKVMDLCLWIETLTDKELFEPEQRKWATTKAKMALV